MSEARLILDRRNGFIIYDEPDGEGRLVKDIILEDYATQEQIEPHKEKRDANRSEESI